MNLFSIGLGVGLLFLVADKIVIEKNLKDGLLWFFVALINILIGVFTRI